MLKKTGRRLLRAALLQEQQTIKVTVILGRGLDGPPLKLNVSHGDMTFVLKVKVECALRLLQEVKNGDGARAAGRTSASASTTPLAEDIELEFRGIPMRDMMAIEKYGVDDGNEVVAVYVPQPTEKQVVPRDAGYMQLDDLLTAEPGIPSAGMLKKVISRHGHTCQVCWRRRWFRCEILHVYSTSILVGWLDWQDSEWPNFFLHVALAASTGGQPGPTDETWRVRWHESKPNSELPVVQPRFSELPPLNWVKSFLRSYASAEEMLMLRELQAALPKEVAEMRAASANRHRCIVIGASGVGKTSLVSAFLAGPPESAAAALLDGGQGEGGTKRFFGLDDLGGLGFGERTTGRAQMKAYWPTVGTRCREGSVQAPGLSPLALEIWDTSGNVRFKPLSLVFYRQAQSVILVFDVKSLASFKALGAVGGWLHEFTRLTGATPANFPFVLVGNKAEEDVMHSRQVYEEDVREWLYTDGGRMPYIETSLAGDPRSVWRSAEHVFRTVARSAHHTRENLGRHRPPDTVRVPEEPDYVEDEPEAKLSDLLDARGSFGQRLSLWAEGAGRDLKRGWKEGIATLQEKLPLGENKARSPTRKSRHGRASPTPQRPTASPTPGSQPGGQINAPQPTPMPLALVPHSADLEKLTSPKSRAKAKVVAPAAKEVEVTPRP